MDRLYEHVMCDLETLGTAPGATILSIGLVPFNVEGVAPEADRLHLIVSRGDSERLGFVEDPATLGWWGQQSWEAQETLRQATEAGLLVRDALEKVDDYLVRVTGPRPGKRSICEGKLWGNGSDFDNALLTATYTQLGIPPPWSFWHNRCFRTLKGLGLVKEPVRQGVHHNALDDALHQARWAVAILGRLEDLEHDRFGEDL